MYEGMFLLDSNRFSADPDGTQQAVLGMLDRVGAKVVASRPWQEGKLAYPIGNHRKGLY
ncbi:MAG: 30S ribosomal protein S6, partial [Planctomycetales bacterium 12-60-4]